MGERSLDLNSVLFHGLEPVEAEQRTEKALEKLESVLQIGAILSRNEQLKRFDMETHKFLDKYTKENFWRNWNGKDHVSICKKQGKDKSECESGGFFFYVAGDGGISIALSQDVFKLVDSNRRLLMDGELQVKDSIPLEYMVGILFGGRSFKEVNDYVKAGEKGDITQEDIKEHFPQDLVEKQDGIVRSIRGLLCKYGYDNIPIYSSRDGFEIGNVKDVMEEMGL